MAAARVGLGAPAVGCLFNTVVAHPVLAPPALTHPSTDSHHMQLMQPDLLGNQASPVVSWSMSWEVPDGPPQKRAKGVEKDLSDLSDEPYRCLRRGQPW